MKLVGIVLLLVTGLWGQLNIPDAPLPGITPTPNFTAPPLQPTTQATSTPKPTVSGTGESSSSEGTSSKDHVIFHKGTGETAASPTPGPGGTSGAPTGPGTPARQGTDPTNPNSQEDLFRFIHTTNFVVLPVTVKDGSGRLVQGLLPRDFSVYEDGQIQNLRYFTSDPFPLSVAFVIDINTQGDTMKKVNSSLGAVIGAFSPYDEVSVFTYGDTWRQISNFTSASNQFSEVLKQVQERPISTSQPPIMDGPLAGGPRINNIPIDPNQPHSPTPPKVNHVLNDAIFHAAQELAKRDPNRRRVIFVVSTGLESGSEAPYKVVLRTLQEYGITVYGMNVGEGAIPLVRTIERTRVPKLPISLAYNAMPKYASATGGTVYSEFSEDAIQDAYAKVTQEARDQYTLGYYSHSSVVGVHRSIEVRVHQPNLKVYAREGYYSLPTKPASATQ